MVAIVQLLTYTNHMTYLAPKNSADWLKKHHRLTNYMAASALYLKSNYDLARPIVSEDIKPRILGHWGTVPGINLIYGGLDVLIKETNQNTVLITGPGHGAPAILANLFVEGSLSDIYPHISHDLNGMSKLIHDFSWPKGFPSHTYPGLPGSIHEGGELGYSLGTAFGAAFDNPELMVACIVGDGEAETGALAASWHSNKFLNPKTDGTVLPILHLNGYKISNPTIFGTMSQQEIEHYFTGLGYEPLWVSQYESGDIYSDWLDTLFTAYSKIKNIKENWQEGEKPRWPMIVLKTKKGWTGPTELGDQKLEDNNLSHGIPLKNPKTNEAELKILNDWLSSYKIAEFFDDEGNLNDQAEDFIPELDLRIGKNKHTYGGREEDRMVLPDPKNFLIALEQRGQKPSSELGALSVMLRDTLSLNPNSFRVFSPDESESNKLEHLFEASPRVYEWPLREWDRHFGTKGQVMEILSEQTLQSWMQGYNMTGRNGLFVSYEAFLSIIASQIDQYMKFLHQMLEFGWRKPVPSMNYIATSSVWRQDHNGFTHQNPILINSLLSKHVDFVSVYFPIDVNTMIYTMQKCLKDTNYVNLIVAGKTDLPQWLTSEEAKNHVEKGLSIWSWLGNEGSENPDVVLSSAGDYQTLETVAAISLLRETIPELKTRYVGINEINCLGFGDDRHTVMNGEDAKYYFTSDREIILNFHGYPEAIKQLVCGNDISMRMTILGYNEKGSTTTPFDMQIRNGTSRYHVAILAIQAAAKINHIVWQKREELVAYFEEKIREHNDYIVAHGEDLPEIQNWVWPDKYTNKK